MNTPAHIFLAAAIAAKPDAKARNAALIFGAVFPDLMMFVMVAWERWVNGLNLEKIFSEAYFSAFWQEIFAINNSAPMFALILGLGLLLRIDWLWAFGLAAMVHALLDLPLHNDDGHPHFWPFTDWIYVSPVSYWDPNHHGFEAGLLEAGLCLALAVILLRRFKGSVARGAIAVGLVVEFTFAVGFHLFSG